MKSLKEQLTTNFYPGRGIIIGATPDGKCAATAYFIMGRSVNSRNRIFVEDGEGIRTKAFDESKLSDPSLIIYAPVRVHGKDTIVTNGDQTDTVFDGLTAGKTFEDALREREFEPDAPNFTPRISGIISLREGGFDYSLSILKSADGNPASCRRFTYGYDDKLPGTGHFIHTYLGDGAPLPSFEGEPRQVEIPNDIDEFTSLLWNNLNADNKVSLFVRFIRKDTGKSETRIMNKNK